MTILVRLFCIVFRWGNKSDNSPSCEILKTYIHGPSRYAPSRSRKMIAPCSSQARSIDQKRLRRRQPCVRLCRGLSFRIYETPSQSHAQELYDSRICRRRRTYFIIDYDVCVCSIVSIDTRKLKAQWSTLPRPLHRSIRFFKNPYLVGILHARIDGLSSLV